MYKQKPFHLAVRIGLLLILIVNVVACASGGNGVVTETPVAGTPSDGVVASPQPVESPSSEPTDAIATATPESEPTDQPSNENVSNDGNVVVTFAGWEYERSLYEPLMEEFNRQNPDITVQYAPIPESQDPVDDYDRLTASSGDTFVTWGVSYFNQSYLRDLQPLLEADPTFETDDFWLGVLEACQDMEGRQLGIPTSVQIQGIYYDQEAFDAAGLPRPKPGWTWDDFRSTVSAMTKKDGDTIRYGYAENGTSLLYPLIETELEDSDGEVDPPALQDALQWYFDLVKEKTIYPPIYYEEGEDEERQQQWDDWQTMFQSESRPVMWPGYLGESLPGAVYEMSGDNPLAGSALLTDGFLPYPVSADNPNDHTTPVSAQCLVISAGSEHPREAWTWLNFLSQQRLARENYGAWERLQLPARQSVADAANYWDGLSAETRDSITFIVDHGMYSPYYQEKAWAVAGAATKAAAGKAEFIATLEQRISELTAVTTPSPTPNTTPVVVATPRPTLSPDVNVINYYYSAWGPDRDAMDALIMEYNKAHSDVAIKLSIEYNGDWEEEDYMAGMAETFDCFTYYTPYWPQTSEENFLSLDSLAAAEGADFLPDFDQPLLAQFTRDGKLYALPAVSQPQVMAYNADLLEKRGLQPPSSDWTFDDFIALATKVSSAKESDLSYGLIFEEWENFLFNARGVKWVDEKAEPPVLLFDTPEFSSALEWIVNLKASGMLLVQGDDSWDEVVQTMEKGQIAFWTTIVGQAYSDRFFGKDPSFKVGIAPIPSAEGLELVASTSGASEMGHFISASSNNVRACWSWITFLSEQPTVFNGVPARKSVAVSPEWEAKVGPENAEVYRVALARVTRQGQDEAYDPITSPYYSWEQRIVQAALKGEDYQKLLPEMQQMADDYLVCMSPVDRTKMTEDEYYNEVNRCAQQVDPDGDWMPSGGGG